MRRLTTFIPMALCMASIMSSCGIDFNKPDIMNIDNSLTPAEKAAGILTPEVMWKMSRIGEATLSPDGRSVLYSLTDYSMGENKGMTNIWKMSVDGHNKIKLTDGAGNDNAAVWSGDDRTVYFISDRSGKPQLWSVKANGKGMFRQLTDVKDGIEGFSVSPKGDKVLYIKRVQVGKHRSSDIYPDSPRSKALIYDDLMARHWNRWDDGSYLHIFIADFDSEKVGPGTDIMEGEPWDAPMAPYFDMGEIAWNNAGTQVAYTCKKMTGLNYATSTDSDIYIYDIASRTTRNICKPGQAPVEVSDTVSREQGILTEMPGYDKYPRFSPDDSMIAFTSMRRAGNEADKSRLFVWNSKDGSFTDLTPSFDYDAANIVWNGNDTIYFIAPIEATYQICRVGLDGGQPQIITSGDHDINSMSMAGGNMICEMTTMSQATEIYRVDPDNGEMTEISFVNKPIYDNISMGKVEKRMVRTTDGKQMLTWVVLPPDFDPAKKYPALLYCQGGPQSVVSQFWSYRWNPQLMAAQGYVVVMPNRRGVPSFGQQWLDQISGDYGGQNIRDYLSAIDNVAKEPWVDRDRLGCVGASYGGYSVYYLAGHHDKRFKAFISHCGMFNFESMYGSTEELWFPNNDLGGPYWSDSPTAQRSFAHSPHRFVRKWDTPILIITGMNDFRIPYTESLQAFTAARSMGIPSRLVVFEDEAHQVFKPQNSLTWNREFFGWLGKYLKDAGNDNGKAKAQ